MKLQLLSSFPNAICYEKIMKLYFVNFPKILLSRSVERKMNEKKKTKKKLQAFNGQNYNGKARGRGGGVEAFGSVIFMTLPTECQFSTVPTLYSASDRPSPLHHPLETL